MRKFYKTVIQVEVLSEDPYEFNGDLTDLAHDITDGGCSGVVNVISSKRLSRKNFVEETVKQGSDPDFFQLDETGKDLN